MKTCPFCAEEIQDAAIKCRHCGSALDSIDATWRAFRRDYAALSPTEQLERRARMSPEQLAHLDASPSPVAVPSSGATQGWNPGVAALLSLVIPGAGQMYKGDVAAGLLWLLATVVGYFLLIVPGLILHLCCILNAASGGQRTA